MLKQALAQVGEVSVRVSRWGHALVHLHDTYVPPGDLFVGQRTQHLPRRMATADGDDETAARRHGRPRLRRDDPGSLLGHRTGISKDCNLHAYASDQVRLPWRQENVSRSPMSLTSCPFARPYVLADFSRWPPNS